MVITELMKLIEGNHENKTGGGLKELFKHWWWWGILLSIIWDIPSVASSCCLDMPSGFLLL